VKDLTIIIKLSVRVDDFHDTTDAVGYVLDSGAIQEAIIEYGADHGFKVDVVRSWHDVTRGHDDEGMQLDDVAEAGR
jgi:hypothetical protein